MKSKDQQLLEEAYAKISEGKYLDNYGRYKGKPKGSPLSDFDDTATRELQNDERNAGLEDDVSSGSAEDTAPADVPASSAPAEEPVTVDPSLLIGKEFNAVVWDYPDYVIQVNGKPTGGMFSKQEAENLVQALNQADVSNPLVQQWYKGAKNSGDL
jgi:hypothetical protein